MSEYRESSLSISTRDKNNERRPLTAAARRDYFLSVRDALWAEASTGAECTLVQALLSNQRKSVYFLDYYAMQEVIRRLRGASFEDAAAKIPGVFIASMNRGLGLMIGRESYTERPCTWSDLENPNLDIQKFIPLHDESIVRTLHTMQTLVDGVRFGRRNAAPAGSEQEARKLREELNDLKRIHADVLRQLRDSQDAVAVLDGEVKELQKGVVTAQTREKSDELLRQARAEADGIRLRAIEESQRLRDEAQVELSQAKKQSAAFLASALEKRRIRRLRHHRTLQVRHNREVQAQYAVRSELEKTASRLTGELTELFNQTKANLTDSLLRFQSDLFKSDVKPLAISYVSLYAVVNDNLSTMIAQAQDRPQEAASLLKVQENLQRGVSQLERALRRMGLTPIVPQEGDLFMDTLHRPCEPDADIRDGVKVAACRCPGVMLASREEVIIPASVTLQQPSGTAQS